MSAQPKIAIVTGASRGIGAAIAERLAREKFSVVINYVSSTSPAQALVDEIKKAGGSAIAVQADVSDPVAVRALFDAAEKEFGGVDILVNNAGFLPPEVQSLSATDDRTFDRLVAINLKGTFNALREGSTRIRDGGRIVNLSDSIIGLALSGYAAYAATKAAVEAMTAVMARELRGRNINVNAIAPGPTATAMFVNTAQEVQRYIANKPAPERLGRAEDIAAAVAFLVGPDGAWINGQTLRANGGMV